jgi:GT-D fold-like domain
MEKTYYLDRLIEDHEFRFDKLFLRDIDNAPVKRSHGSEMGAIETNLFHRDVLCGDDYFEILESFVSEGLSKKKPAPVVRFADGEYAFYAKSMKCNGLYQQAESVEAIKKAIPIHVKALRDLNQSGKIAPVVYPGNVQRKRKTLFSFLRKSENDDSALEFLEFLFDNNIPLTRDNYMPFFVVYAYLTSKRFYEIVDGKKICIVSSEYNKDLYRQWFSRFSSRPSISFAEIPDRYVATQWSSIKEGILKQIPPDLDLCLVGAGIGSLLVCVDVANQFSIPAIDAGHVLNMMNGREDKSGGARLYTIRETR